jgi:DNA modification methylase
MILTPQVFIHVGHCIDVLRTFPEESVHCVVTSPPYWGLRSYNVPPVLWCGDVTCAHQYEHTQVPGGNGSGQGNRRDRKGGFKRGGIQPGLCVKCGGWFGQHGLEPTPDLFVRHEVAVFREVWRVLRSDGTLWLNLGDTYATGAGRGRSPGGGAEGARWAGSAGRPKSNGRGELHRQHGKHAVLFDGKPIGPECQPNRLPIQGLKRKELVGIPWRVAFALQADGWYLRMDNIWSKPNPMPESMPDRPTKSHEYFFLLTKRAKYFYDAEAIKEPSSPDTHPRYARGRGKNHQYANGGPGNQTITRSLDHMVSSVGSAREEGQELFPGIHLPDLLEQPAREPDGPCGVNPKAQHNGENGSKQNASFSAAVVDVVENRNKRSVWTVATHPYHGAHYATFPPDLIRPCILAGTSERGCCGQCGAPYRRVIAKGKPNLKTVGWIPTCKCGVAEIKPCTVLDPFGGSGTTGQVALEHGRNAVLVELHPANVIQSKERTSITVGFL